MEIEIITTKKKITQSIFKQILPIPPEKIGEASVLGFVVFNGKKYILFKLGKQYLKIRSDWELRGFCEGCTPYWGISTFKGELIKKFSSPILAIDLYNHYKSAKAASRIKGQIFL